MRENCKWLGILFNVLLKCHCIVFDNLSQSFFLKNFLLATLIFTISCCGGIKRIHPVSILFRFFFASFSHLIYLQKYLLFIKIKNILEYFTLEFLIAKDLKIAITKGLIWVNLHYIMLFAEGMF